MSNDSSFLFSFNSDEIGFEFFLQQSPLADLRFVLGCELRCKLEIEKCWHLSANLLQKNTEGFLPSSEGTGTKIVGYGSGWFLSSQVWF